MIVTYTAVRPLITSGIMDPLPNNTRYLLELERNALLQEKYSFDEKYGTFSFAFLTGMETLALLAYFYIATVLIYYKETRTRTNFIVGVWAVINFLVLFEKLSRAFALLIGDDYLIGEDAAPVSQMLSGLGRNYGTALSVVWLFSKFFGTPRAKYDCFIYFLMALPTLVCLYYIFHYFAVNRFIFEVYGPACDVVNVVVYFMVGLLYILCTIFLSTYRETSQYALMISLANLITNFPVCMITIYLRFNMDISWYHRFHIYFVDFFVNAVSCSNAFAVLFLMILYNKKIRQSLFKNDKNVDSDLDPEQTKMTNDYYC
ncbi:hypothetical protein MTP99_002606 [Tenebrio molitor]|nr:hypothetical protein MTP99_002606 [Tenebrio molitor]